MEERRYIASVPQAAPVDQSSFGYHRYVNRNTGIAAATLGIVFLGGCAKDVHSQDAVRQGVMSYLAKRSDLLAMDVTVASIGFRQDEATAEVHFQAKGNSSPAAGMSMQYVLERKGGQWVVKGRTGSGASHGASGPAVNSVPGQGTLPGSLDGMPALPPGHPSVSSDSTPQQR
jgi:hypothetical protein